MRRGPLRWALSASACALALGCNALLGNSDRAIATDDASTLLPLLDAGSVSVSGATDSGGTASGQGERDAEGKDAPGADAEGATLDGGANTGAADSGVPPIVFVQVASRDTKSPVATASATYSKPQRAGDFNVAVIGWSDPTRTVSAISDSTGNSYALATAPASTTGVVVAIYYATNIAGAALNTVTVDLDATDFLCLAILEYSGVSEVDRTALGTGSSATAATGTVVTSLPHELVFGAGEPDQTGTANFASAGTGFNERVITGISGMLAEDTVASQIGTYAATGGLTSSSPWVMQVVTFK